MNTLSHVPLSRIISHILFLIGFVLALTLITMPAKALEATFAPAISTPESLIASKTISMENRYANKWVSDVFKDNMLLAVAYMHGMEKTATPDWNALTQPFTHEFRLQPGETFAFHDTGYLPEYAQSVTKTTTAHFGGNEGFKSSGKLMGDGVCHLASLYYWAAFDANIEAKAPVNHDFAIIPEIDKKYGVAIYSDPANAATSMQQNLYIRNNQEVPLIFRTIYTGTELTVEIIKQA